jgi:hypothetical protein
MTQFEAIIFLLILEAQLVHLLDSLIARRKSWELLSAFNYDLAVNHEDLHAAIDQQSVILDRLSSAADRERGIKQAMLEDGKLTRERISQVKTRLADDERDDQQQKRHDRRQHGKA